MKERTSTPSVFPVYCVKVLFDYLREDLVTIVVEEDYAQGYPNY